MPQTLTIRFDRGFCGVILLALRWRQSAGSCSTLHQPYQIVSLILYCTYCAAVYCTVSHCTVHLKHASCTGRERKPCQVALNHSSTSVLHLETFAIRTSASSYSSLRVFVVADRTGAGRHSHNLLYVNARHTSRRRSTWRRPLPPYTFHQREEDGAQREAGSSWRCIGFL